MPTIFQQLLDAKIEPQTAAAAIVRHVILAQNDELLTADVLPYLTVPAPVVIPDEGSIEVNPYAEIEEWAPSKSQEFSKHRILAHLLLFHAYSIEDTVTRTQAQLVAGMARIYNAHKQTPRSTSLATGCA